MGMSETDKGKRNRQAVLITCELCRLGHKEGGGGGKSRSASDSKPQNYEHNVREELTRMLLFYFTKVVTRDFLFFAKRRRCD